MINNFMRYPMGLAGIVMLLVWIFIAIFAPLLAPYHYSEIDVDNKLAQVGAEGHPLGSDNLGRDILSRILYGSRTILLVSFFAAFISSVLGIIIGFFAGYRGGNFDLVIMRFLDILVSLPPLVLGLVVLGISGQSSPLVLTLLISLVYSPQTARVARSALLAVKANEYIEAAKMRGESVFYILFVEILPNAIGPIIVEATARFAYSIMTVASLGFLGVGLQPPTPDWGMMVIENKEVMTIAPWTVIFPSLAIATLVIAISLFSDFMSKVLINE